MTKAELEELVAELEARIELMKEDERDLLLDLEEARLQALLPRLVTVKVRQYIEGFGYRTVDATTFDARSGGFSSPFGLMRLDDLDGWVFDPEAGELWGDVVE